MSARSTAPQLRYRLVDEAAYPREALAELNSPVADLFRIEKSRDWQEFRASIHRLRSKFGSLTPEIEERVRSADADRLLEWSDRLLRAESLQDVFQD